MEPEERAAAGLFLAFQYPVEIPGVGNMTFLRTALNAQRKARGEDEMSAADFLKLIREKAKALKIDAEMLKRPVNVGFSGGEKKRNEILQMAVLEPKMCILDETDSGLDVDAMKLVADGVNALRDAGRGFLVITHYQRLLDHIKPDVVHIMADGRIVKIRRAGAGARGREATATPTFWRRWPDGRMQRNPTPRQNGWPRSRAGRRRLGRRGPEGRVDAADDDGAARSARRVLEVHQARQPRAATPHRPRSIPAAAPVFGEIDRAEGGLRRRRLRSRRAPTTWRWPGSRSSAWPTRPARHPLGAATSTGCSKRAARHRLRARSPRSTPLLPSDGVVIRVTGKAAKPVNLIYLQRNPRLRTRSCITW